MTTPTRVLRAVLAAAVAVLLIGLPGLVGGATADTIPPATSNATTPLVLTMDPYGDVQYDRLAGYGRIPIAVKTSAPATIRVEVLVPASIGRALKLKVKTGAKTAVLAATELTATAPGYVDGTASFSKRVAKRLAAKPRAFKLTLVATSGDARATTSVRVVKKD